MFWEKCLFSIVADVFVQYCGRCVCSVLWQICLFSIEVYVFVQYCGRGDVEQPGGGHHDPGRQEAQKDELVL